MMSRIDKYIRSHVRIFFSLDMVGSTAFKQRETRLDKDSTPSFNWLPQFLKFYQLSNALVQSEWQICEKKLIDAGVKKLGPAPEFWKGAGDEVIYSKEISSPEEAFATVLTSISVLNALRLDFNDKPSDLDVKATAWIAGFPVNNSEIVVSSDFGSAISVEDSIAHNFILLNLAKRRKAKIDYIGPTIDLGFRLSSLANARKYILSCGLALLVATSISRLGDRPLRRRKSIEDYLRLQLGYDGRHQLKGILGGEAYPVFWIETLKSDDTLVIENELTRFTYADPNKVKRFCGSYLNNSGPLRTRPYFVEGKDPDFAEIPDFHSKQLSLLREKVKNELGRRRLFTASGTKKRPLPEGPAEFLKQVDRKFKQKSS